MAKYLCVPWMIQTLPQRPSKLPVQTSATTKSGPNANKPVPLSVSNHNIPSNYNQKALKDAKKPISSIDTTQPTMKRKLQSSQKDDARVSRVKLNNNTPKLSITNPKRATSITSSTKSQSNSVSAVDKQHRPIAQATSIVARRQPLAANNVKKATEEKESVDNKQQPIANPTTGMPKLKKRPAWDTKGRLSDMEQLLPMLQSKVKNSDDTVNSMKDLLEQEHNKSKIYMQCVLCKAAIVY